jgi:nitrate/nitrite transporter NarK
MGLFFALINVYYLEIGLSGVQIGLLSIIGPLVGGVQLDPVGMASDRFGRSRLLFLVASAGTLEGGVMVLSSVRTCVVDPCGSVAQPVQYRPAL